MPWAFSALSFCSAPSDQPATEGANLTGHLRAEWKQTDLCETVAPVLQRLANDRGHVCVIECPVALNASNLRVAGQQSNDNDE
jgi:hypothetical protein